MSELKVDHKERRWEDFLERKSILLHLLYGNIVEVKFIKVDGTNRTMMCTLKSDLIPEHKRYFNEESDNRKDNPDVIAVYDIEKEDWRSFKVKSVYSFLTADGEDAAEALYPGVSPFNEKVENSQLEFEFDDVPF